MHEGKPSQAMRVRVLERKGAFQRALSWPVARRSLTIAVIIGSVLNLINQGDTLYTGGSIDWLKAALTYCVPFCVSTYGAYCAYRLEGQSSRLSDRAR
jgi:hypothetical protein